MRSPSRSTSPRSPRSSIRPITPPARTPTTSPRRRAPPASSPSAPCTRTSILLRFPPGRAGADADGSPGPTRGARLRSTAPGRERRPAQGDGRSTTPRSASRSSWPPCPTCQGRGMSECSIRAPARGFSAFARRRSLLQRGAESVHLIAVERDADSLPALNQSLSEAQRSFGSRFSYEVRSHDFLNSTGLGLGAEPIAPVDIAIANPPYFKVAPSDPRRRRRAEHLRPVHERGERSPQARRPDVLHRPTELLVGALLPRLPPAVPSHDGARSRAPLPIARGGVQDRRSAPGEHHHPVPPRGDRGRPSANHGVERRRRSPGRWLPARAPATHRRPGHSGRVALPAGIARRPASADDRRASAQSPRRSRLGDFDGAGRRVPRDGAPAHGRTRLGPGRRSDALAATRQARRR